MEGHRWTLCGVLIPLNFVQLLVVVCRGASQLQSGRLPSCSEFPRMASTKSNNALQRRPRLGFCFQDGRYEETIC